MTSTKCRGAYAICADSCSNCIVVPPTSMTSPSFSFSFCMTTLPFTLAYFSLTRHKEVSVHPAGDHTGGLRGRSEDPCSFDSDLRLGGLADVSGLRLEFMFNLVNDALDNAHDSRLVSRSRGNRCYFLTFLGSDHHRRVRRRAVTGEVARFPGCRRRQISRCV